MEYGRIGCNFYTGCPHNCEYCYLKRGITGKALGGTVVQLKKMLKDPDTAITTFRKELWKYIDECRKHGIFFSFTCDPLIAETRMLTQQAVLSCRNADVPVWLLTKDAAFIRDEAFMRPLLDMHKMLRRSIHFGFTLTGRDDMEPMAARNYERIMTMGELHEQNFPTWASIEPVIDWTSSFNVIQNSLPYCDHYKIGLRSGVKKDYYDWRTFEENLVGLVDMIVAAGKTVYLKESVKNYVVKERGFDVKRYGNLLLKTVDLNGKPYRKDS